MSAWADRWVTIQWVLVGAAVVGVMAVVFYMSQGQDTAPIHGG